MTRKEIEQAVHAGVVAAVGRSLAAAVQVISDSIEAQMNAEPKFIIAEMEATVFRRGDEVQLTPKQDPSPTVASASEYDRLQDLAPIVRGTSPVRGPSTFREYHSVQHLQELLSAAPETISVLPSGYAEPLEMRRVITTMATDPIGLQLAYKVPGSDADVAFPKEFFWTTDEEINVTRAVGKIKSDALAMYARRTKPIEQHVVAMAPLETRMNKAGDVYGRPGEV